jgi:glucosylceramidase
LRARRVRRLLLAAVVIAAVAPVMSAARAGAQPEPTAVVGVVQTAPSLSQQLTTLPGVALSTSQPAGLPILDVNEQGRYQQVDGLGGAMTDSAASLIYQQLAPSDRLSLMRALFGSPGSQNSLGAPPIHLNFLRVAMGASGAMTTGAPYSYDDLPAGQSDPSLSQFSIAHDLPYIIPTLQQALAVNPGLRILANPWSPPGWMKTNGALDNTGGQGSLLLSAYQSLADYFVKFIQAYAGQGIPIYAVTPQNEPRSGGQGTAYPGLTLPEASEEQFIAQNLKPTLAAAGLGTKIYGHDLSWDQLSYASALATGSAAGDLSGIAWHCYFGSPTVMSQIAQTTPGLDQIVDECSPEIRGFGTPEFLISSLRNGASTVSVWGLALDPQGGPIQPGNNCPGCRGIVTINPQTQAVTFRTGYYQLGQVSAFVQPGASRIDSPSLVTYGLSSSNVETVSAGLDDVAFVNPDGSKVLVAYNNSTAPISFAVRSDGRYFSYTIPPQAMTTFTWDAPTPVSSSAPTITGVAQQGRKLAETHGGWSNSPTAYRYQWLRCDGGGNGCTPIAGASSQTYTLANSDVGSTIRIQETAINANGSGTPARSAQTPVVLPLVPSSRGAPTISGVAQQRRMLVESHGDWSNAPTTYRYQWVRCDGGGNGCSPIPGASGQRYVLAPRDVGSTIRVRETATNAAGSGGPVRSAKTRTVLPSTASLRAMLVKVLSPPPSLATMSALLKAGGYSGAFRTLTSGRLEITWLYAPGGLRGRPATILVARGSAYFSKPGLVKFKVRLTRRGEQMFRSSRNLNLTATGTYNPAASDAVTATRVIRLRR